MTTTADIITRMLTDREKATEGAQALADHWQAVADKQRQELDETHYAAPALLYGIKLLAKRQGVALRALARVWRRMRALEREIEEARKILSAQDGETLVEAAMDCVREEQTSNEAYQALHALYWKEAMPELKSLRSQLSAYRRQYGALFEKARAVVESAARELNYSSDVLLVSTAALRELARCVHEPAQSEETRLGI